MGGEVNRQLLAESVQLLTGWADGHGETRVGRPLGLITYKRKKYSCNTGKNYKLWVTKTKQMVGTIWKNLQTIIKSEKGVEMGCNVE